VSQSTLNLVGAAAFIALFALCAVFLRIARTQHPDVWRALGSPSMFRNQDFRTSIRGMRYFLSRGYRSVPDRRFVIFCDLLLIIEVVILASFLYFVASTIIFFVQLALRY
jgi:hypothetical protein